MGVLIGSGAIILSRQQMGQKMPFGPFLALSAVITVFSSDTILSHKKIAERHGSHLALDSGESANSEFIRRA